MVVAFHSGVSAQTTTFILLRHAEKDTSVAGSTLMKADPPLNKAGEQRAQNLIEVLKAFIPDAIYSTNYTRTKTTVAPIAKKFSKEIQLYDPRNLVTFAEQLQQMHGKTILIAGHSNTTPGLVNLLIKEKKYPDLEDSVYNQLWMVTIKDGKAAAKQITY